MPSNAVRAEHSASTASISLRIRHPSIDPRTITATLGITPEHSWAQGEPRLSESGARIGGTRRDTYWSAMLSDDSERQRLGAQANALVQSDPVALLMLQVMQLKSHHDFFKRIAAEGGQASLVLEIATPESTSLRLEPLLMRLLADLGLPVHCEFIASAGFDS
jgi:hypothetical protein